MQFFILRQTYYFTQQYNNNYVAVIFDDIYHYIENILAREKVLNSFNIIMTAESD